MFSSKLRSAANAAGAALTFARSTDAALQAMRNELPALVIFDLNNPRIDALSIAGRMKLDPALASVPTIGFSQHTAVDVISAAKKSGIDRVLARSAFFERLPDILAV